MDIIKILGNVFLEKIFPNGLVDPVFIGQIGFDVDGRISLNIHTKQKPSIETEKWGVWGKNYNVIVIKLNGICKDSAIIKNWKKAEYAPLSIGNNGETLIISQMGQDWNIELECIALIFNGCSTYIEC